eukprot:TRINITY_DN10695_c0_g2_i1.p1 TRINITY_DN10695_c0_g2~~TRINITY_DN10695_c0_g2_i1.p1  ORF type:complete len:107 (+),score=9.71 TRINITY_DN10695_c0_g2_i1:290-610(+)
MMHQTNASKRRKEGDFSCRLSQLLWTQNAIAKQKTKAKLGRRRFLETFAATDGGICCFLGRIRARFVSCSDLSVLLLGYSLFFENIAPEAAEISYCSHLFYAFCNH